MGFTKSPSPLLAALLLLLPCVFNACSASRKLLYLYKPPAMGPTYHNGSLLEGRVRVSILWYGKFTPAQKAIVVDFLASLNGKATPDLPKTPTVSHWWQTIQIYMQKAGKRETHLVLSSQLSDENCSMGKLLKRSQVPKLARRVSSGSGGLALVLTAKDVAVEGFCTSNCGHHGHVGQAGFVWVGDSATQCPGRCAWPFHQPVYGPQTKPLGAPNGDVGVDGVIVNMASLVAGAVTNPFGGGYYQGPAEAPLEAASACPGMYGEGSYPGYAGELLVDSAGGSYNAVGANGRKYLLPALYNPNTSECSTIV